MYTPTFILCWVLASGGVRAEPEQAVSVEKVTLMLRSQHFKEDQRRPLLELGARAFPAYEAILKNPKSDSDHVERVLFILAELKIDRKRLLEPALGRLADADSNVRFRALGFIAQVGSERDTAPIIALLSDDDTVVRRAAARALARIGGSRDVIAMDAWLKSGSAHRKDGDYIRHVKECRDELEKRLKEPPKDTKN